MFGNMSERRRQAWECRRQARERRRQDCKRQRHTWEHLESLKSNLGKTSSLGTLQVRLEIIATTYCPMIFKTYVFTLYSHLCNNVSMYLYSYQIYTRYIWTSCRRCLREIRGAPEIDDRVNSEMRLEAVIERVWR